MDHKLDRERNVGNVGDAFSPGWYELPLAGDAACTLQITASCRDDAAHLALHESRPLSGLFKRDVTAFEGVLRQAAAAFLVRRGSGRSVIAGYPWFLDWGRDTLIAARGYLAAGLVDEVQEIVRTYAGLERHGTLPNLLSSDGAVSRETSDAPLWLGLVAEELAQKLGDKIYDLDVGGRSLLDVLKSIVVHHLRGAENGVIVDGQSGLVWSPPHFTWMDTNYPAGTPREGYPIEIGALWARLVQQLARRSVHVEQADLTALGERAAASLRGFYRPELGYCADTLHASRGTPASAALADDHLRPNQLLAVSLGFLDGEPARNVCHAVERHLLIPGALRSLAPLPVRYPLAVCSERGEALNDPHAPYFGRYEGDEDTRRKPAYHNGTGWGFQLPSYAEALLLAHPGDEAARAAARAVLGSVAHLLDEGCIGQLPENVDGDAPHRQRGCDAQAWSVTEALRVWLLLQKV
jgi:predicted glycogen debranching enzyme